MQHAQLLENLDDDFETIFGREFLRAYEAQSRVDPDAGRGPDPGPQAPAGPSAGPSRPQRRPQAGPDAAPDAGAGPNADPTSPEEPWPMFAR